MNDKMRHTAHLLVGPELASLAPALRQYTMMYGASDASDYLQVLSCQPVGAGDTIELKCHVSQPLTGETQFTSGIGYRYHVGQSYVQQASSDATLQQYFVELFNRTVTIDDPGETGAMNLCFCVCLYDAAGWQLTQRLIQAVVATAKPFVIDVLGLPAQLATLLADASASRESVAELLPQYRHQTQVNARAIIECADVHRLLMFEDANTKGLALNLDRDSLIRILGEFSLIAVESYPCIFPPNQLVREHDVTTFGISMLAFDKVYFIDYLLHNAYLEILGKERVQDKKVNVNKAAQVAGELLSRHVHLYHDFEHDRIDPTIAQAKNEGGISISHIQRLEGELQERLDRAVDDLQSFITDEQYSMPEKQAIMAQLLGEDDALLQGVQFQKGQLTLDDCDAETINMFLAEDNKQVRIVEATATEPRHVYRGILSTPLDEHEHVYLPIEQMKLLRAQIRQRAAFKRQKETELAQIDLQLEEVQQSQQRISDGCFTFDGNVFRLLPSDTDPRLFQETYQPHPTSERNVDLRASFTEIKSQGELGACSAFALVSIFEQIIKSANPSSPNLSEMFVFYNALREGVAGGPIDPESGTSFYDAIKTMSEAGLCTEDLCPYGKKVIVPSEYAYDDAKSRLVKCAKNVDVTHEAITSALAEGYPVAISLRVFNSFQADRHGFVYRPSDADLASGDDGYHAMVVCGFSEEDKVYIVRNSWGTSFGDRGYCYIPFSYIDDPDLCNQACIITDIEVSESVQVGRQGTKKTISFNLTDDSIRAAILRILIDEENRLLERDNKRYATLRYSYEQLIQTVSNPTKQDQIFEQSITRLNNEIGTLRDQYNEFVSQTRPDQLKQFRVNRRLNVLIGVGVLSVVALITWMLYYFEFMRPAVISSVIFGICLIIGALYLWQSSHNLAMLKEELDDKASSIKSRISRLEIERDEKHLRMHLAGKVVSSLTEVKIKMINKYHSLVEYIAGLDDWAREEQQTLHDMEAPSRTPCIQLLTNADLDRYFSEHRLQITEGLHLYDLVDGYHLSESDILAFKIQIRDQLIAKLQQAYSHFSMVEYVTGRTSYPYLSDKRAKISELMPLLDHRSDCFLHICQTGVSVDETLEKSVFVHTERQSDRNAWRDTYAHFFGTKPGDMELTSRYKLIELQILHLKADQVALLQ